MNPSIRRALAGAILATSLVAPTLSSLSASAATHGTKCIVSLSPSATETLYAIGAGSEVAAVDSDSNYPTTGLPKKKIDPFAPNAEAIATICPISSAHPSAKPNLVVVYYDANHILEKLHTLGITTILQGAPTNLKGAYHEMTKLGWLTSHRHRAARLVASLKSTVARDVAMVTSSRHGHHGLTMYWESDSTLYSLTSATFFGALLKSLGVVNVADAVDKASDYGYPQLSREYLIASSPQLVFLADTACCGVNATNFAARPGFSMMRAVRHDHVVGLNDDVASRWGPRLGDLMNALSKAVIRANGDSSLWKK